VQLAPVVVAELDPPPPSSLDEDAADELPASAPVEMSGITQAGAKS
jgi:hypothetical protein